MKTTRQQTVRIDTDIANSTEIPYEDAEFGEIHIPAGATTQTLTFHSAEKVGGTYKAAFDSAATPAAVAITGAQADRAYPIPTALRGAGAIKIVAGTADIADVLVSLKG